MPSPVDSALLIQRFDDAAVKALVLLGSHMRGEAATFSDIDLLRLLPVGDARAGRNDSHLIDGDLCVVSNVDLNRVERRFNEPQLAVEIVAGLRDGRALVDCDGTFAAIRARADSFTWDAAMQQRADRWVGKEMVGWIEEVHKVLNGLQHNDLGRLLAARRSLNWGMLRIMQVQRGVMLQSENYLFDAVTRAVWVESE